MRGFAWILVLVLAACVAACDGEPSGRVPPDDERGLENDIVGDSFHCGNVPAEWVWYPPTGVTIVGSDAIFAPRTRFRCPNYSASGSIDLTLVSTNTLSVDVFVDGAANEHGVSDLSATFYPPDDEPVTVDASDLEPEWYRVDVPKAADDWGVRLDLVTQLDWQASYAFRVSAGN